MQVTGLVLVALGGAVGSVARYAVGAGVARLTTSSFPFGTLTVNALGCFAIGLLVPAFIPQQPTVASGHLNAKLFLITGVLGGFTTFSAFGLETYTLYRGGHAGLAAMNAVGSVLLGLGAVALGVKLGRGLA